MLRRAAGKLTTKTREQQMTQPRKSRATTATTKKTDEGYEQEVFGTGKVNKVVLAAVTIEETKDTSPHKFQVIRQGDQTVLQLAEDSLGTEPCRDRTNWPTEGLIEALDHAVSDDFKKESETKTTHAALRVTWSQPMIELAGSSQKMVLKRAKNISGDDNGLVQINVGGYPFIFHDDDLKAIQGLLLKDYEVRTTRTTTAPASKKN